MITTATPVFSASKRHHLKKGIAKQGTGLVLLLCGMALIIYGFNAPMTNSSDPSQVSSLPDLITSIILLGGTAAVVVGVELTFLRKIPIKIGSAV